MIPPRQLTPNTQSSNNNTLENRTRSPHRPTRSIGSSWGFSGIDQSKDDEDDEDEDTTDSDEDEKTKHTTKQINGSSGRPTGGSSRQTSSTVVPRTTKGKGPTVEEDLSDDPD